MRVRITFAKIGPLRYTGHLDLHRIWERTCRRAGLLLSYSQGFHPQPKIQLAAALPLGFASRCELADLWFDQPVSPQDLPQRLQAAAPGGLHILHAQAVDERTPPLQTLVHSADYEVTLRDPIDPADLTQRLDAVTQAQTLSRTRRNKAYDLRPLIEDLRQIDPNPSGQPRLFMRLAAREGATGRPEEVLDALGIAFEGAYIERTALHLRSAGAPAQP